MEEQSVPKSILNQILDEMFSDLEGKEEFDLDKISKLRDFAYQGNLSKSSKVLQLIKSLYGGENEAY